MAYWVFCYFCFCLMRIATRTPAIKLLYLPYRMYRLSVVLGQGEFKSSPRPKRRFVISNLSQLICCEPEATVSFSNASRRGAPVRQRVWYILSANKCDFLHANSKQQLIKSEGLGVSLDISNVQFALSIQHKITRKFL